MPNYITGMRGIQNKGEQWKFFNQRAWAQIPALSLTG